MDKQVSDIHWAIFYLDPVNCNVKIPPILQKRVPKTVKELENHPLRREFEAAQRDHLEFHKPKRSWEEVDKSEAKGHDIRV